MAMKNLATVFIAHSYGGLVVEKAIVQSRQPNSAWKL
jgi:predicted alpha/beta hydrolase family esterase